MLVWFGKSVSLVGSPTSPLSAHLDFPRKHVNILRVQADQAQAHVHRVKEQYNPLKRLQTFPPNLRVRLMQPPHNIQHTKKAKNAEDHTPPVDQYDAEHNFEERDAYQRKNDEGEGVAVF